MFILKAPIYAFYSKEFYRLVSKLPLKRGFLYLAFLTLVSAVFLMVSMSIHVLPQTENFKEWIKAEMPPLVWSAREGLRMGTASPYTMTHPEMGPLVVFDMGAPEATLDQYPEIQGLVTREKIYFRNRPGQMRVFDLNEMGAGGGDSREEIPVDPEMVETLYGTVKPWAFGLAFIFFLPTFYVTKLGAILIYSLLGLVVNQMRREKLTYPKLFNVTLFAMTPILVVQMLQGIFPVLGRIPFGFLGGFVLMSGYLYLGVKMSEEPENSVPDAI